MRKMPVLAAWFFVLGPVLAAAQDSLTAARDLYASAAYEDALAVLNRLPDAPRSQDELRAIEQYRAFCLLALGRTAEAEHAIELVIAGEPNYQPAGDVSPRVRAAFSGVRRRLLPGIIQRQYADAKAAYDRKNFMAAAQGFQQVLNVMNDPDAVAAVKQPPLSDLKTLAIGFHDLAVTAEPPPLPAQPVKVDTAPPPAVEPPPPPPPRVYGPSDAGVLPPVVIQQELPSYPGPVVMSKAGVIEVSIDENGRVESAVMRKSVSPAYDTVALAAARMWRYRPATLNGTPVKYRKAVQITVRP